MTVSWVTPLTSPLTEAAAAASSSVRYGTSPLALDTAATGYAQYYTANFPGRANYTSGLIHHVTLAGLQPATQYYYVCGGDTSTGTGSVVAHGSPTPSSPTSGVQSFTTLPAAGDPGAAPLTVGIIGDLGQTSDSAVTVQVTTLNTATSHPATRHLHASVWFLTLACWQHLAASGVAMVLHAGDLSYADCDPARWDSYGELVESLSRYARFVRAPFAIKKPEPHLSDPCCSFSAVPWMVGPGNHEVETLIHSRTVYVNRLAGTSATARRHKGDKGKGQGKGIDKGSKNNNGGNDDDDDSASTSAGSGSGSGGVSSGDTNVLVPGPAKMFVAFESRYRMPEISPAQYGQITYSPQSGGRPWQPTPAQPDPPCGNSVFQVRLVFPVASP